MSERSCCKDSETRFSSQAIVKLFGWKHVKCSNVVFDGTTLIVEVEDTRHTAKCPSCGKRCKRIHSYYVRHIDDLSVHGHPTHLSVRGKRYRCENPKCRHKTFAAQVEGITERYGRRTVAARQYLEGLLANLTSRVGANQARLSGIDISVSTALRIVANITTDIRYESVRQICIDDFAFRKGQTYRTLVADADTGMPLEVICSRDEKDVSRALKKYKKVRLVSRDRAGGYDRAVRHSLPKAAQVADRFHLVMNSGDHVSSAIKHNIQSIRDEIARYIGESATSPSPQMFRPPEDKDIELFNRAKEMKKKGMSLRAIAKSLDIGKKRVDDLCKSETPHGRKITAPKQLLQNIDIVDAGVKAGKSYMEIYQDLKAAGRSMSYDSLTLQMKKVYPMYRPKQGVRTGRNELIAQSEEKHKASMRLLSSGCIHLYVCNPDYGVDKKTGECSPEHVLAERLISYSSTLRELRNIHNSFRSVLKEGVPDAINAWIDEHRSCKFADIQSFVRSVSKDIVPIKNSIRFNINNGLIEGLNNKVKAIKRSMYGRAGDDLLWKKLYLSCLQ